MLLLGSGHVARRVYLSAAFSRWQEVQALAGQLATSGCEVVSTWHNCGSNGSGEVPFDAARNVARQDLEEVQRADLVVILTQPEHEPLGRGGRHVEFGAAMAWAIPVAIVGSPENIFHSLAEAAFTTPQDLLDSCGSVYQPLAA